MNYKKIQLLLVFLILIIGTISAKLDNDTADEKIDAIVVFKDEIKQQILEERNIEIKDNFEDVAVSTIKATKKEIEELRKNPDIESVEEDFKIEPPRTQVSRQVAKATVSIVPSKRKVTESILEKQSVEETLTTEQLIPWGVEIVNAPNVWYETTGKNIKVAVIDSGIDYNNEDLKDNVKGGISFIDDDYIDTYGHGTYVAGVIAALDNDFGIIGVAPNVDLYAVKFMDETGGTVSDIIKSVEWCIDNEIDVKYECINGNMAGKDVYYARLRKNCSGIAYNDVLSKIRVNCTFFVANITSVHFKLINIPDNLTFIDDYGTKVGDLWVYDNEDITILDSGDWRLEVKCAVQQIGQASSFTSWTVPWGYLVSYLISPFTPQEIRKYNILSVTAKVKCVGGECGDVKASLDPIAYQIKNKEVIK